MAVQHATPLKLDNGTILNSWYSGYMHMKDALKMNTNVDNSKSVGKVGRAGATNDHLHFAIYSGDHTKGFGTLNSINTQSLLKSFSSKVTYWY